MPRAATLDLLAVELPAHENYDRVNRGLAAHFALASWYGSVANGRVAQPLAEALRADEDRARVELSFTHCRHFRDEDRLRGKGSGGKGGARGGPRSEGERRERQR
jgi:hypothetical protein